MYVVEPTVKLSGRRAWRILSRPICDDAGISCLSSLENRLGGKAAPMNMCGRNCLAALTAGAALIAACAVDVPAGERTEVRFRLTPNAARADRLSL